MILDIMRAGVIIIFGLLAMMVLTADAGAATVGTLAGMGYTIDAGDPGDDLRNVLGSQTIGESSYTHTAPDGQIVARIYVKPPAHIIGETVYFNLHMTDGTTHKGSWTYNGDDRYTLIVDGSSISRKYNFTNPAYKLGNMFGLNQVYFLEFSYVVKDNDKNQFALFVQSPSDIGFLGSMSSEPGIIISLAHPSEGIKSFSMMASSKPANLAFTDATIAEHLKYIYKEPVASNTSDSGSNMFGLQKFTELVGGWLGDLITIGTGIIELFMLLGLIVGFLLNPLNDVLILMQFEMLVAIMALSGPGDILNSGRSFLKANVALFNALIGIGNGLMTAGSILVNALSGAASAMGSLGQTAAQGAQAIGTWLSGILFALKGMRL